MYVFVPIGVFLCVLCIVCGVCVYRRKQETEVYEVEEENIEEYEINGRKEEVEVISVNRESSL